MEPEVIELSIIVPAYNEAAAIVGTLTEMRDFLDRQSKPWELIVSADGTDGTREAASHWAGGNERIQIIGAPQRRGKGRGVREGVLLARASIVGFVDADYKTPIDEIEKLLPWFDRGFDVVIGSRRAGEAKIEKKQKLYRRMGSKLFAIGMRAVTGLRGIADTQCGFKFFTAAAAKDIFSRQTIDGYMFDVEVLRLAQRLGYRVKEVGVRWQDDGDSRLDLIAGNWQNVKDIVRIGLRDANFVRGIFPVAWPSRPWWRRSTTSAATRGETRSTERQ
jgi:dolichyl-phosphate beta-glucosyltransferase